jgi:flagellar basal body-associated protein FliL
MITKFDTTGSPSGKKGGSSTMIFVLLGLALVGYGYYRFVHLPKQKKEEEKVNQ